MIQNAKLYDLGIKMLDVISINMKRMLCVRVRGFKCVWDQCDCSFFIEVSKKLYSQQWHKQIFCQKC